jgi:hypothetical protein
LQGEFCFLGLHRFVFDYTDFLGVAFVGMLKGWKVVMLAAGTMFFVETQYFASPAMQSKSRGPVRIPP